MPPGPPRRAATRRSGRGDVMILVLTLVAALAAMSATVGGLAVVTMGIRREEKSYSLTGKSPGRAASGARAMNGLHTRGAEATPSGQ